MIVVTYHCLNKNILFPIVIQRRSRSDAVIMKKLRSIQPSQKKLTQFFSKRESDSKVKPSDLVTSGGENLRGSACCSKENGDKNIEDVSVLIKGSTAGPTVSPRRCSPRKISQRSLHDYSPTKGNPFCTISKAPYESPSKNVSNKNSGVQKIPKKKYAKSTIPKNTPPKKEHQNPVDTPQKKGNYQSPVKLVQPTLLKFSPSKKSKQNQDWSLRNENIKNLDATPQVDVISVVDLHSSVCVKGTPKKRKFLGSPLKEKQNESGDSHSKGSSKEDNSSSHTVNNAAAWDDEVDFMNMCETVVTTPKKAPAKKQKYDESALTFESKHKLDSKKTKVDMKQNLSEYFQKDLNLQERGKIKLDALDRYEVLNAIKNNKEIQLTLKSLTNGAIGVCFVRSPWDDCNISAKDVISVKAIEKDEGWVVDWNGLLVLNPDILISGTAVVGSVYCMRKSILSHVFKESGESGSSKNIMVIGSLVHELFQEVLKLKISSKDEIEVLFKKKISSREFMLVLFLHNMNYDETVAELQTFLVSIHKFMMEYVFGDVNHMDSQKFNGQIVAVEDIEENIWSPVLGIKGKIDATVEVRYKKKNKIMPLELKTGKVSFSIEHRGQVILYCMLLQQMKRNVESGLLLYLKSGVEMKEIKCEEREIRDLTMLRNGLSHWLTKVFLAEAKNTIPPPILPPPINRRICSSCPYLVPCSAALSSNKEIEKLPKDHHLKELGAEAVKHLSKTHMDFVFHWLGLLSLEKCSSGSKMSDLWSVNSDLREKSGKCLANVKMDECQKDADGGFMASFSKLDGSILETEFTLGQLLIVSSDGHLAQALGVVKSFSPISLTLKLDKSIKTGNSMCLDAYEGDATTTILTNNLTCLLENSPRASRLREFIIDLKLPTFSSKVSSRIKKVGGDIFERLNKEQIRAIVQAIASENYILIRGMPGAGKTTTMAALIELLTRLKKRVLVTSFTHSAIDNILINVIGKVKMLRIGPEHRIHPKLKDFTEHHYLKTLEDVTPAGIERIFSDKEVVGVTCFGCKHPWVERQVFDVCLVDEASQVSLPAIIKPVSLAEKFILVGDPKQLPPLVLNEQAKKFGLGKSLFEWLERPAVTSPLTQQYRMNSVITSLVNDLTYGGQLQCADESIAQATLSTPKGLATTLPDWLKETLSPSLDKSVIILDIKCEVAPSDVGENKLEATTVVKITDALIKGGVPADSIGVIATYSRQVTLLKSLMKSKVEVNTVDQYQGRDKEVIIYSTTRAFASAEKKDILSDWSRLTVAITRAKKKLIILGSTDVLKCYENFQKLISSIPSENIIIVPLDQT